MANKLTIEEFADELGDLIDKYKKLGNDADSIISELDLAMNALEDSKDE